MSIYPHRLTNPRDLAVPSIITSSKSRSYVITTSPQSKFTTKKTGTISNGTLQERYDKCWIDQAVPSHNISATGAGRGCCFFCRKVENVRDALLRKPPKNSIRVSSNMRSASRWVRPQTRASAGRSEREVAACSCASL